jgi:hypothetical protein
MMTPEISISVGKARLGQLPGFAIKIQTLQCELNIWIKADEVALLHQVKAARWDSRGSLNIGSSAGVPVFWSSEDDTLSILVGHDDETWDFGLILPIHIINEIISNIETEQSAGAAGTTAAQP